MIVRLAGFANAMFLSGFDDSQGLRDRLRQLGHVRRNPPRLTFGEQLGSRSAARRSGVRGCRLS
jgi:hypothetical protein